MPTLTTTVGPQPLPAVAGAANATFVDETGDRLADYVAFWLNWGLTAKLGTMTTPPATAAVLPANIYTTSPTNVFIARNFPALFVYGNSKPTKYEQVTCVHQTRTREFDIIYAFERVKNIEGVNQWAGLITTVDAIIARAFDRMAHPNYTYDATTTPGTNIRWMNSWEWVEYMGGVEGFLKEYSPASLRKLSSAQGGRTGESAQGGVQGGNPCFRGTVRITELVGQDTALDPDDASKDISVSIAATEGPGEILPDFLERSLSGGDGTDDIEAP